MFLITKKIFSFALIASALGSLPPTPELEAITSSNRLPSNAQGEQATIPLNYTVELWSYGLKEQDLNANGFFEFSGDVEITVQCNTASRYVVVHTSGHEYSHVLEVKVDGILTTSWEQSRPKVKHISVDKNLILVLSKKVKSNKMFNSLISRESDFFLLFNS